MPYILKNEFVSKKGEKKATFFVDTLDIPIFGPQCQITTLLSEAKRFMSNGEAAKYASFFSKTATIEYVDK
tara:strand:+ start:290 stop:502 length:213 start_codon:yes stop_codon:yes gene_type:complete